MYDKKILIPVNIGMREELRKCSSILGISASELVRKTIESFMEVRGRKMIAEYGVVLGRIADGIANEEIDNMFEF